MFVLHGKPPGARVIGFRSADETYLPVVHDGPAAFWPNAMRLLTCAAYLAILRSAGGW